MFNVEWWSKRRELSVVMLFLFISCGFLSVHAQAKRIDKATKKQIKEYFLNKFVTAKMIMPMTTRGVAVWWSKSTQKWYSRNGDQDIIEWGVGVNPGLPYLVTEVKITGSIVTVC